MLIPDKLQQQQLSTAPCIARCVEESKIDWSVQQKCVRDGCTSSQIKSINIHETWRLGCPFDNGEDLDENDIGVEDARDMDSDVEERQIETLIKKCL